MSPQFNKHYSNLILPAKTMLIDIVACVNRYCLLQSKWGTVSINQNTHLTPHTLGLNNTRRFITLLSAYDKSAEPISRKVSTVGQPLLHTFFQNDNVIFYICPPRKHFRRLSWWLPYTRVGMNMLTGTSGIQTLIPPVAVIASQALPSTAPVFIVDMYLHFSGKSSIPFPILWTAGYPPCATFPTLWNHQKRSV